MSKEKCLSQYLDIRKQQVSHGGERKPDMILFTVSSQPAELMRPNGTKFHLIIPQIPVFKHRVKVWFLSVKMHLCVLSERVCGPWEASHTSPLSLPCSASWLGLEPRWHSWWAGPPSLGWRDGDGAKKIERGGWHKSVVPLLTLNYALILGFLYWLWFKASGLPAPWCRGHPSLQLFCFSTALPSISH